MNKKFLIILLIMIVFLLAACWDAKNPEENLIGVAIGFDYNPEEEMYQLTLQTANPIAAHGGVEGGGLQDKPNYWTVSAWGYTTLDALANIRKKVSRFIHYSHTQLFVISEEFAKEKGVLPVIDVLERSRQSRPIVLMAVTKDDPGDILEAEFPIEDISALAVTNMINLTDQEIGTTVVQNGRDFIKKLSQPGLEAIALVIDLSSESEKNDEGEEERTHPGFQPPLEIEGAAVFKKDKLVGFLEGRGVRGFNWATGQIKRAVLNLELEDNNNQRLNIVATEVKSKIEPVFRDAKPEINLRVEAEGVLQGVMGGAEFERESELVEQTKKQFAQVIRNDIELALDKAQELESDIFGFGNSFYRLENEAWQNSEEDWEQTFTQLPVNIEVEVILRRTGMIEPSINVR